MTTDLTNRQSDTESEVSHSVTILSGSRVYKMQYSGVIGTVCLIRFMGNLGLIRLFCATRLDKHNGIIEARFERKNIAAFDFLRQHATLGSVLAVDGTEITLNDDVPGIIVSRISFLIVNDGSVPSLTWYQRIFNFLFRRDRQMRNLLFKTREAKKL